MRLKVAILAGLVAVFLGFGCGEGPDDDAGDGGDDGQQQQQQEDEDQQDSDDSLQACGDAEQPDFLSHYELRFNDFAFDDGSPGSELNPVIDDFLDQSMDYPIIVLLELADIDVDEEEINVRGGAGLHAEGEGEYQWDDELEEPESAPGTFDEDGQLEAFLPEFQFVATVQTEEELLKTIIPIRDIELEGTLRAREDGTAPCIDDGWLEGIIWYEDVEDVEIALSPGAEGIPLTQVLGTDEMNTVYGEDAEENDAWEMEASFQAEQTVIVD